MNIMCHPGFVTDQVAALLSIVPGVAPQFGVPGLVALRGGTVDAAEVDMQIGDTNVEAKLTETSFTSAKVSHVERYEGLYDVFDPSLLPISTSVADPDAEYQGYQLLRNVLAIVRRPTARFCVLLDARRPDLHRE